MLNRGKTIERIYVGKEFYEVMDLPNLVDIQLLSYEKFLQRDTLRRKETLNLQGLEEVFQTIFPIESPNKDMVLEYDFYNLDEENIKLSEAECKRKGVSYAIPVKARINLIFQETGEIRQKDIYVGDVPLMTDRGTFIINGAERVVVSQIHRSPGVIFAYDKGVYTSRIIPYRGSWLEFEIDSKKELVYTKIDRKKRILGTLFLRALGFDTREKIIDLFYKIKKVVFPDTRDEREQLIGKVFARALFVGEGDDAKKLYKAGERIRPHDLDELEHAGVKEFEIIDLNIRLLKLWNDPELF